LKKSKRLKNNNTSSNNKIENKNCRKNYILLAQGLTQAHTPKLNMNFPIVGDFHKKKVLEKLQRTIFIDSF